MSSAGEPEAVVRAFVQKVFVDGEVAAGFDAYVSRGYIQHHPNAPAGYEANIRHLADRPAPLRTDILRFVAQGDIVVVFVRNIRRPGDLGRVSADMFRVEGGLICEHWCVAQDVPETSRNDNGMF